MNNMEKIPDMQFCMYYIPPLYIIISEINETIPLTRGMLAGEWKLITVEWYVFDVAGSDEISYSELSICSVSTC